MAVKAYQNIFTASFPCSILLLFRLIEHVAKQNIVYSRECIAYFSNISNT